LLQYKKPKALLITTELSKLVSKYQKDHKYLPQLYRPIPQLLSKFKGNIYILEPYMPLMKNKKSEFYKNLKIRLKPDVRKMFIKKLETLLREESQGNG
jgi:hypothetical protein